jgi:hypothetical protein
MSELGSKPEVAALRWDVCFTRKRTLDGHSWRSVSATRMCKGSWSRRKSREAEAFQEVIHVFPAGEYRIVTAKYAGDEARREAIEYSDLGTGARHVAGPGAAGDHQGTADRCPMRNLDCGLAPAHGFGIVTQREVCPSIKLGAPFR